MVRKSGPAAAAAGGSCCPLKCDPITPVINVTVNNSVLGKNAGQVFPRHPADLEALPRCGYLFLKVESISLPRKTPRF
ncbi:MAG: hypothetical protein KKD83_10595 [Chloroflexi bacterium]|nr:hypothetical protein [Chloroflexota bacterium]